MNNQARYWKGRAKKLDRRLGYYVADLSAIRAENRRLREMLDTAFEFARMGHDDRCAQIVLAEQHVRRARA